MHGTSPPAPPPAGEGSFVSRFATFTVTQCAQFQPGFQCPPAGSLVDRPLQRLGQPGGDDVGNPLTLQCRQDGLVEKTTVGAQQADSLVAQVVQGRFEKLQGVVTVKVAVATFTVMESGRTLFAAAPGRSHPACLKFATNGIVKSRLIIWHFMEQLRLIAVPLLHGLHRRGATERGLG